MDAAGDYIIQKQLGHGPFGEVYLAEHRFIKRNFALKALPENLCADPSFIRRFEANIASIAGLDHPHILKIHNVSYCDGRYFVVTDPIVDSLQETIHLERFLELKGKSLSEEEVLELLKQIASALDYAHAAGIVHGSLKLTNIFVVSAEKGVKLLLSDFGISRLVGEGVSLLRLYEKIATSFLPTPHHHFEKAARLSQTFLESLAFLAPEQKKLDATAFDLKVDAYAFGILAYYTLLHQIPEGCFDPPSKSLPELKGNWDLLISRLLQVNPNVRPKTLMNALQEYLAAPKTISTEMFSLSEIEKKVGHIQQMAFEFPPKLEPVLSQVATEAPRP
ncbi:MAG: serine/threonine protein kinase, partial [Chlamydiae bacterium]|nr:serine/threonine protein kinase [Chlamydiota bacterium]